MKNSISRVSEFITLSKSDKRPIAKFYRCWLEDTANGIAVGRCRGINHEQFRAADRLAANYARAIRTPGNSLIQLEGTHSFRKAPGPAFELQVNAMHIHQQVLGSLSRKSQEIIEHFCLLELPIRQFELKQVPAWPKGAGSTRLREALDDLVEVYRIIASG